MADRALRLSIALLSEVHWVSVLLDADGNSSINDGISARRTAVAKVLAEQIAVTDEGSISRVVEFLPEITAYEPIPLLRYSELADLLRNNVRIA